MSSDVCAQTPEQPADVASLRISVLSQTIDEALRRVETLARWCARLDGDIADLQAENASLRRRVTQLEHGRIAGQAAHNKLAGLAEKEIAAVLLRLEELTRP